MSYQPIHRIIVPVAFDLSASPSAVFTMKMAAGQSMLIKDVTAVMTEASGPASSAAGVLSVGWLSAVAAASETEVALITPGAQSIGDEVGVDTAFDPFEVKEGETLYLRLKTQASGGTTTGAGYFVVSACDIPKAVA